jgi:phenylacetate-CoA ligase
MTLDKLETRSNEAREKDLFNKLPAQIDYAKNHTEYFKGLLKDVNPAEISSREMLAKLPVTRKSDLSAQQKKYPPFGGMGATKLNQLKRIFQSPGPIHEPQGLEIDSFRLARSLRAAGFSAGDLVHNTFSYHFTPGAWMMEGGAHALGCCVFPAGTGQTEMQASTIAQLKPNAYTGTPSFLKIILEKADELGLDSSSLKKALVSGEALTPSLRSWFTARGISIVSAYATADVGLIAYETPQLSSGMIIDEEIILEIVEPNGTNPVPIGDTGEVVITVFDQDYPLIRFGTGDLSAIDPASQTQASPCGRTNLRIKGWLGRADQTTKIKGMFVHPSQVHEIVKKHPQIKRAKIIVSGTIGAEEMTVHCILHEAQENLSELNAAIVQSTREVTKLRATICFANEQNFPEDGKVIVDERTYS